MSYSSYSSKTLAKQDDRPVINLNVPLPKDVVGKVRVTTVSTKTQVRYKKNQEDEDYHACHPSFRVTRSWSALVNPEEAKKGIQLKLESEKCEDYQQSLGKCTESNYLEDSKTSYPTTPVYSPNSEVSIDNVLVHKRHKDNENLDSDVETTHCRSFIQNSSSGSRLSLLYRNTPSVRKKQKAQYRLNRSLPMSIIDSKLSSTCSCDKDLSYGPISISKNEQSECFSKDRAPKGKSLYTYNPYSKGMEPNYNHYSMDSRYGYEEGDVLNKKNDAGMTPARSSEFRRPGDEGKIYRILNVEKQLTYVPEVSPNKFCKPNAVIKRYRTVENPITECESSKYFTGFEKVFPNPLTNLSIFFKKKETIPPRIETKIRTTMVSEIVDRKEVGNDAYKNFIDTHEIDEEIPIHFTKLSKKQIEKNDPRILRVADVITVAQIKKVTPEQLRNRF
ncbi:uncharacterized protein [Lepeophtheirus salmonis]|uniref:uncharacterized protein n=1 Tax=Lepeophtheirus salmonis TaxID=72036 RepID=UPI001AE755B0|nr:uncharacterized protein LOC121113699 [Lepeophtheirus salmonis]